MPDALGTTATGLRLTCTLYATTIFLSYSLFLLSPLFSYTVRGSAWHVDVPSAKTETGVYKQTVQENTNAIFVAKRDSEKVLRQKFTNGMWGSHFRGKS
jgi:hypothetical protein